MKRLSYVVGLTRFAFKANPGLYLSIALSLISVAIELLAMLSLLPLLSSVASNGHSSNDIISNGLRSLGFSDRPETLLWTFLILLFARIVTQVLGQTVSTYLGRRVMAQLGATAFDQITKTISLAEINSKSIGFYIGLAGEEAFRASVIVISLTQFASTVALSLLYFAAIARYSPSSAGLITLFLACSGVFVYLVTKSSYRLGARQAAESRAATSIFLDSLNNLKAVRSFSAESYVSSLYRKLIFGYSKTWFWIDEVAILTKLVPIILLLLVIGTWLALSKSSIEQLGLPFIVTMIAFFTRFFPTLGQGVNLLMKVAAESRSGKDITSLLELRQPTGMEVATPLGTVESIDVRNVSFRHGAAPDKPILDRVSVRFEHGNSYAVVGKSGIGKSTLIDLLLKFYPPMEGAISINGQSIEQLTAGEIRKHVVLVSQDAAIFNDSVANNICLGLTTSTNSLQTACRTACIDEFIEQLPNAYATQIQYHGKNLSGGQRQRIAIARGLLRNPDVIIFDESTNALDKKTQSTVVDNILRSYAGKIVIFVTHDPEIIERMDVVIDLTSRSVSAPAS